MPENELALGAPVTGWLYQPLESGGRDGTTVAVGEGVSTLMYCPPLPDPAGPVTSQNASSATSFANDCVTHVPGLADPPDGDHVQYSSTGPVYQPAPHATDCPPVTQFGVTL